jgi:hypothetical protein
MLGHKSATMTLDLYGHRFSDRLDEVADVLDAAARAAAGVYRGGCREPGDHARRTLNCVSDLRFMQW